MACMQKGAFATRTASRRACVRVEASVRGVERAQIATATFAAAALLASPAFAGVQLAQPALKKVFVDDSPPKVREAPQPREASKPFSLFGGGSSDAPKPQVEKKKDVAPAKDILDPRIVALPASIGFCGATAFAFRKLDEEFDDWITRTSCKDSSLDGLGYEQMVKSSAGGIYGVPTTGTKKTGTKKVKAAKKK